MSEKNNDLKKFRSLVEKTEPDELTSQQKAFLDDFILRYNKRTEKSKAWMATYRPIFADWLSVLGYRQSLKEIRYPIVARSSSGSRIWDIDGNEYIDIAIGYGVSFLGHNPPFVIEAVEDQLKKGIQLGPQFEKTGELAELLCEITGNERVFFSNTGTEAVMSAIRIARAYTGRNKIVIFNDSFHGHFDGVRAVPDENGVRPKVLGIPQGMIEDVIVLEYGSEESLEIIRARAHELAGVLVEPFQTRRPWFHPTKEYLQEIRAITAEKGAALIFDEVVTGFRIHLKGAQEYFGIKADIVTYGKTVGGGMPISAIAGKSAFMDMIDGGMWNYGDNTHPHKKMTAVAGTFCKHPLAVMASLAVLKHMKREGNSLQERVNLKMENFAKRLNAFFDEASVPLKVCWFSSICQIVYLGKTEDGLAPVEIDLLFPLLMLKGVFAWEMRVCCFSAAHTDDDVDFMVNAVKESIAELRNGGFPLRKS